MKFLTKIQSATEIKIDISLGKWKETFVVYETNAPLRYDYSYCLPISKGETRLVLIPVKSAKDQIGRYQSGNYWAKTSDQTTSVEEITDILFKRLKSTDITD